MRGNVLCAAVAALLALLVAGGTGCVVPAAASVPSGQHDQPGQPSRPDPPGALAPAPADDGRCRPAPPHRDPVVLLHGLGSNAESNWAYIGPELRQAGYCVFALTYGQAAPDIPIGGLRPIAESAALIADYIDQVLDQTGADKVDIVGHSQGGLLALYVTKVLGLSDRVDRVVALAPPTHGTTVSGLVDFATVAGLRDLVDDVLRAYGCHACVDALPGSPVLAALADGPIAQRHVDYTIVTTRYDLVVTPPASSFVDERGVHNIDLQDLCPDDPVGHVWLAGDPGVLDIIRNALDPSRDGPIRCGSAPPW